jgi:hypothetical protein
MQKAFFVNLLMWFFVLIFIILVGGGWLIGKFIGSILFPDREEKPTYIDKSVNHHYHTHIHEHKNLTVIDEETHRKGLEQFKKGK